MNKKFYRALTFGVSLMLAGSLAVNAQKVTFHGEQVSLKQAFEKIEAVSKYKIAYNTSQLDVNRRVVLNQKDKDVLQVMRELLEGTECTYQVNDNYIVITSLQKGNVKKVQGNVKDAAGEPVIGATVMVKGTSNGTITDFDGNFVLDAPEGSVLEISYIGYKTQQLAAASGRSLTVTMKEDTEVLDEVVVVGYGTMRKSDLTGAIAAVKGDKLAARRTTQLSTALQGAIAGVTVTRDNSAPGATAGSIKVRGVTTIGDTSPLVIIDGIPGNINDVNPNDVESMSVLKDAASASIYGSRAAAGVILITTKRAKESSLSINYNFEYGLEIPTKQPEYVGVKRFLETTNELRYNDNPSGGWNQAYSTEDVENWEVNHLTDPDNYPMTDWTDLILKGSAPVRRIRSVWPEAQRRYVPLLRSSTTI